MPFSLSFSSTEDHGSFSPLEGLVRPDVTQDSPSSEASSVERESTPGVIKSRARERRREGRSKTFDWAEFRPIAQALAQQRAQEAESLQADLGELERGRRREERRKRYESVTSVEHTSVKEGGRTDFESGEGVGHTGPESLGPLSVERQQRVEEVIEQHWRQVEKTPVREERRVPLPSTLQSRDTAQLEQLLDNYKQGVCVPVVLWRIFLLVSYVNIKLKNAHTFSHVICNNCTIYSSFDHNGLFVNLSNMYNSEKCGYNISNLICKTHILHHFDCIP